MWYKGTEQECVYYNYLVTKAKNYQGITRTWSSIVERGEDYYVKKHEGYDSEMELVESLPDAELE